MRKYRELLIFGLVLTTAAVLAILGMKAPVGPSGHVLSAEPRPWFGASPRESCRGLSLFGIAAGDSIADLEARLSPDYRLEHLGDSPNIYTLRGRHLDVGLFTSRHGETESVDRVIAYDLGAVYFDGQPLTKAGTVKVEKTLDRFPPSFFGYGDGLGQGLTVERHFRDKNAVDFLFLFQERLPEPEAGSVSDEEVGDRVLHSHAGTAHNASSER